MGTVHERDEWLNAGMAAGYCTPPYCSMHDGSWLTAAEGEAMEAGADPCVIVVRLWDDPP